MSAVPKQIMEAALILLIEMEGEGLVEDIGERQARILVERMYALFRDFPRSCKIDHNIITSEWEFD